MIYLLQIYHLSLWLLENSDMSGSTRVNMVPSPASSRIRSAGNRKPWSWMKPLPTLIALTSWLVLWWLFVFQSKHHNNQIAKEPWWLNMLESLMNQPKLSSRKTWISYIVLYYILISLYPYEPTQHTSIFKNHDSWSFPALSSIPHLGRSKLLLRSLPGGCGAGGGNGWMFQLSHGPRLFNRDPCV